ncbi:MAG: AMP-binding protein [Bacilli bacterium]|nr:AMP-binding protein [Bacilli bacterium]
MENEIKNPRRRVVEDLKIRNKDNMKITASEYFGNKYSYAETFKMFEDYKKAFISLDGVNRDPITISAPSIVSSVNAFYGAMDANKIVNLTGPGFLYAYPEKYTTEIGSKTVVIFDGFLNEELINKLHNAGVKNVIITSITDYMSPIVKKIGSMKGLIKDVDFLDEYVKSGKQLPSGMQFIRMKEFAKAGSKIKENIEFPYEENQIGAYFLTGATTSRLPKCVQLYSDGFTKMAEIYDKLWFDFKPGDRQTVFIPMFYATGAVHGIHAGLFSGMTMNYKPKYDRFAFAKDLADTKAKLALVAPSHVATLENSGLKDGALSHLKYVFIGGEAVTPAQMKKFRETGNRLGIEYILDGYGMTETGSMSGISDRNKDLDDVTIVPAPGVKYRIVDPMTREILPDNVRGILEKSSPCQTAGYLDESKNAELFTEDNWINTGDVAIRYSNGKYRVFGRGTDYFENNRNRYYMFDIEEKVLEHPGVAEAEVIKFTLNNQEYPAIVTVLNKEWESRKEEVLDYISNIKLDGMEFLIGTKFIDKFKTNPITAKRDYLILPEDKTGYYKKIKQFNTFIQTDIEGDNYNSYPITCDEIEIVTDEKVNQLKKTIK